MTRRNGAFLGLVGLFALLAPSIATADHLFDAIGHTREAIAEGRRGGSAALVTHAKAALRSATAVYATTVGSFSAVEADARAQANAHLREGLANLKAAVVEGKKKHVEAATQQAEQALTHLEAAPH
jgi:Small metal-binding protein